MTSAEHALWRQANDAVGVNRAWRPCADCPAAWAAEMRAQGRCNGEPGALCLPGTFVPGRNDEPTHTVVHLVGAAGSGKSTLRARLEARLDVPGCGIDAERLKLLRPGDAWPWGRDGRAWAALRAVLDSAPLAILETLGAALPAERLLLAGRDVLRVRCVAPDARRLEVLRARVRDGYPLAQQPGYVERVIDLAPVRRPDDVVVRPHADLDAAVATVIGALERS